MERVDLVVAELAASLGLDSGLDEERKLVLLVEDRWLVTLVAEADEAGLVLFAKVAAHPPADASGLRTLLEANFLWQATFGATLALEPASGALVLHRRLEVQSLSVLRLRAALADILRAAQTWARAAADLTAGKEQEGAPAASAPARCPTRSRAIAAS